MTEEIVRELGTADGKTTVALSGEIDVANAGEFYDRAAASYAASRAPLVLDCAGLNFIDSTALGSFVKLYKLALADGNRVTVRGAKRNIRKLFAICALDDAFDFED